MSALVKGVEMPKGSYKDIRMYDDGTWVGLPLDHVKPMTNADRIRSMTDEELAEFLPGYKFGFNCPPGEREQCPGECVPCWRTWLQQEVKE